MVWNDSFSIGVDEIDTQHRDFIRLINRLQIMHDMKASRYLILRLLMELAKFWEYHFTSEENLMIIARYPGLEHHRRCHLQVLQTLNDRYKSFETGEAEIDSIIDILKDWLDDHIRSVDKLAGQFINKIAHDRSCVDLSFPSV
jgi:hemerythrin-like metal-binding protein